MQPSGRVSQSFGKPTRGRKRRRRLPPREETTLVCLIKSLVERRVVVELRNDILLRGRLDDVDDFLNMSLSEATFQTVEGHKRDYESIYVKGRNVRFVHLPKSLDPAEAIESYRRKVVQTKLQAAQERARALGSAKPTPKGQDALDTFAASGSAAEDGDEDDEGMGEGEESSEGEGEAKEMGGDEAAVQAEGGGGSRLLPGLALQHLDPRMMVGRVSQGTGGEGDVEVEGFGAGAGW